MSLPDLENCYSDRLVQEYTDAQTRDAFLDLIDRSPDAYWPTNGVWSSFKNPDKIYGSPMLDDALARHSSIQGDEGEKWPAVQALLQELRSFNGIV